MNESVVAYPGTGPAGMKHYRLLAGNWRHFLPQRLPRTDLAEFSEVDEAQIIDDARHEEYRNMCAMQMLFAELRGDDPRAVV